MKTLCGCCLKDAFTVVRWELLTRGHFWSLQGLLTYRADDNLDNKKDNLLADPVAVVLICGPGSV